MTLCVSTCVCGGRFSVREAGYFHIYAALLWLGLAVTALNVIEEIQGLAAFPP